MSRTKREIPYKHWWCHTKESLRQRIDREKKTSLFRNNPWHARWLAHMERELLLHGTDTATQTVRTHEYFNRAHRVGRRVTRDQLRPHIVLGEGFDFDDSRYRRKLKSVWWDIY